MFIRISPIIPLDSHCLGFKQSCLYKGTALPQKLSDVLSTIVLLPVQWISTSLKALFWVNFCFIPSEQCSLAHDSHVGLSKFSISLDRVLYSRAVVAFKIFLAVT